MPKVLIAEDDGFTRALLLSTVSNLGYEVTGEVATAAEAMKSALRLAPDIALLDLDLGQGPTGVDVANSLRKRYPNIGIVILTSYEEPRLFTSKLKLPANAIYLVKQFISKPTDIDWALQASRESSFHEKLNRAREITSRSQSLSEGQIEIMRLVASGLTNVEIGKRRYMSAHAVNKAIARLVKQLGLEYGAADNQRVLITQAYFMMTGSARPRRD